MNNINPKDVKFALDVGTMFMIGSVGIIGNNKFKVIGEEFLEHEERAM